MAPVLYLQDKSSNFADGIEDDNWEEQAANRLTDAMQGLDERSQDIIRARWLDEDNKSTLQELADRYGVSAERVRQLEKNAMKKLRRCYRSVISAIKQKTLDASPGFLFFGLYNNQFPLRQNANPHADC